MCVSVSVCVCVCVCVCVEGMYYEAGAASSGFKLRHVFMSLVLLKSDLASYQSADRLLHTVPSSIHVGM